MTTYHNINKNNMNIPEKEPITATDTNDDEQQKKTHRPQLLSTLSLNNNHSITSINSNSGTNSRPKLYSIHSSETSRFPTLEKLENSMLLTKRSSKITVEPVTFTESNNNNMTTQNISASTSNNKKGGSQVEKFIFLLVFFCCFIYRLIFMCINRVMHIQLDQIKRAGNKPRSRDNLRQLKFLQEISVKPCRM
jgi:hypothetical protein